MPGPNWVTWGPYCRFGMGTKAAQAQSSGVLTEEIQILEVQAAVFWQGGLKIKECQTATFEWKKKDQIQKKARQEALVPWHPGLGSILSLAARNSV